MRQEAIRVRSYRFRDLRSKADQRFQASERIDSHSQVKDDRGWEAGQVNSTTINLSFHLSARPYTFVHTAQSAQARGYALLAAPPICRPTLEVGNCEDNQFRGFDAIHNRKRETLEEDTARA